MPSSGGRINFQVGLNIDKGSFSQLKNSLKDLQNIKITDFKGTEQQLKEIQLTAIKVDKALEQAFNVNLNSVNINTFNEKLKQSNLSVDKIYSSFSKAGAQGQAAFSKMAGQVLTTNLKLKETHSVLESMGTTMMNTVKWGIASSIMNNFTGSVKSAFNYVKSLESSLTDIRIVTGDSQEKMDQFAESANKAAQALGRSTMDYTKSALTFYQQGLSDEQVAARTQATLKAQNITGAGAEMADYLTSVWNGYKVANEQAELYVDKLAAVADSSASDMSQLAIAMSKVASSANNVGVDVDSLNSQLATVIATTRQAPESVGTAFKTIYARINDIATGAEDAQVSLGRYSEKMASLGFNVLDANGKLRDTRQVIEEIGNSWGDLSKEQQIYLAQTMAGQRQYNNLIALFDNWNTYTKLLNTSLDSQGTLTEKNGRYMESLGAKMEQLGAAQERVKSALISEDDFAGLIEALAKGVDILGSFVESIGGGRNAILLLGTIATRLFGNTIAKQISSFIINAQRAKQSLNEIAMAQKKVAEEGQNSFNKGQTKLYINDLKELHSVWSVLSNEQKNEQQDRAKKIADLRAEAAILRENQQQAQKFAEALTGKHKNYSGSNSKYLQSLIGGIRQKLRQAQVDADNFFKHIADSTTDSDSLTNLSQSVGKLVRSLGNAATNQQRAFAEYLDRISKQGDEASIKIDELDEKLEQLFRTAQGKSNKLQFHIKTEEAKRGLKEVNQELEKQKKIFKEVNQDAESLKMSQIFVNIAGGITQISSGLLSLKNLTKIWADDSLSLGEKVLQITQSGLFALISLVSGYGQVAKAIGSISIAQGVHTKATIAQIAAQEGLAAALHKTAIAAYARMAPFLPYIALFAAISLAIYGLVKAWNKQADAAKHAAEVAQQAKKSYEQTKQSYEDLKNSITELDSAQESMQNLVKNTQQWKDALNDVNNKVLELIEKFPQLAGQVETTSDGMLKFKEGALEAFQQEQQKNTLVSGLAYAKSQQNSDEATKASLIMDANRQIFGVMKAFDSSTLTRIVDAVEKHGTYLLHQTDKLAELTGLTEEQKQAVKENTPQIQKLIAEINKNATATNVLTDSLTNSLLKDVKQYQQASNPQAFAKMVSQALMDAELGNQYKKVNTVGAGASTYVTDTDAVAKRYQELTGQSTSASGKGYKTKNASGDWEQLSSEVVEDFVALHDAMGKADSIYDDVSKRMKNIESKFGDTADIVYNFINGFGNIDFTKISEKDLNELQKHIKDLADIIPDTTEAQVSENLESLRKSIREGWNELFSDQEMVNPVRGALQALRDDNDLTLSAAQTIKDSLLQAYKNGGAEAVDQLQEFYSTINDFDALNEVSSTFNFTNAKAEDFRKALDQAGIATNASTEAIKAYIQAQKEQAETLSPEETYKNIHDIIDGFGDGSKTILNPEEAKVLQEAGIQLDEYFTHMADGTLKLKEDANGFYDYANSISLQGFYKQIEDIQEQLSYMNAFTQSSYSKEGGGNWQSFSGTATNNEQLAAQLQFLYAIEGQSARIAQMREKINNGQKLQRDDLEYISTHLQQHKNEYQNIGSAQQQLNSQLAIYQQELQNLPEKPFQLDADVNEEQFNKLSEYIQNYADQIQGVDESLKGNKEASDEVAQSFLRYDAALAQIIEKYDTWKEALNTGSLQEQIQAASELQNVYSDLLNLQPNEQLSESFLMSADNLQLFKQAAEGSTQAYDELQRRAQEDILVQMGIDTNQFFQDEQYIYDELYKLTGQKFDDIQIGAKIDDRDFIATLQDIVNNAHMGSKQAAEYLSQMGFDAQFGTDDVTTSDTRQDVGFDSKIKPISGNTKVSATETQEGEEQGLFGTIRKIFTRVREILLPWTVHSEEKVPVKKTEVAKSKHSVPHLRIKSLNKSVKAAGGKVKFTHSSHGAGNTGTKARTSSQGTSSSPSRSSSSNKTTPKTSSPKKNTKKTTTKKQTKKEKKDPDQMDQLKDQADRYHDIDISLQKINIKLTEVQKQQKKLTGPDLIKNLNTQLEILKQQVEAYREKIKLAKQEAIELRGRLSGYGAIFSEDGTLANYNAIINRYLDQVNSSINYYNGLSAQAQENYKETVQRNKEQYEEVKKIIGEYDKLTTSTIPGLEDSVRDMLDDIINLNIEKFKIKVDIDLDLTEAIQEWNNFEKQVINKIRDDDILGNVNAKLADFFSYYSGNNLIMSLTQQVQSTLDQLLDMDEKGLSSIYGDNRSQALEDLKKYTDELMDNLEEVNSLIKQIKKSYFDMVNAAQSAFDEQVKEYDFLENLINHDKKLIEMLYGDQAYSKMSNFYQKQEDADKRELDFQRQQKDFWWAQMQAQKARMSSLDKESNEYKEAEERFKELEEHWMSAVNDFNSQLEASISNLLDRYNNSINIIFNDLGKRLTGGKGLDYIGEEWELINDQTDRYFDKIDSAYQLQNLQKAFEDAIESNEGNLAIQQSLNNLMEQQLELLRDKDKLSQYDIDRANLLLQIEMKRIALEQRQQSKSKLRLRRDSQGNYTYQYVSDTEQIAEAQQSLAQAQNELYNLDKTTYRKNLNDIYNLQTNFNQKMQQLYEQYPIWTEEAQLKRKLLVEKYEDSINNLVNDNQLVRLNLMDSTFQSLAYMYDTDVDNFINMSRTEQDELMNSLIPEWNSGIQQMTDAIAGEGGLIPVCQEAFEDLQRNTEFYEDTLDELQEIAQVNFDVLEEGLDDNIEKTEDLIDINTELIQRYDNEMEAIQKVISQLEELTKKYGQAEKAAISATAQAYKYWQQEQKNTALASRNSSSNSGTSNYGADTSNRITFNVGITNDKSSGGGSGSGSSSKKSNTSSSKTTSSKKTGTGDGTPRVGDSVTFVSGRYHEDSYGSGRSGNQSLGKKVTISKIASGHPYPIHIRNSSTALGWVKKSQIQGYDTGGYTGAWGSNGRLGILHEKEIVLNAKDTKNLLSAVSIVRTMQELLESINRNVGSPNMLSNVSFNHQKGLNGLDQNVYITANFPNVNSKIQIEAAFNNLINRASQYVHTNKR